MFPLTLAWFKTKLFLPLFSVVKPNRFQANFSTIVSAIANSPDWALTLNWFVVD
ncbi:hypothetical protein [Nostoc sp. KVJ20]|uniref:hypothetical protein n=1 Tax=Nostoc sp. KVJ20 TaxID=457944 RepID=UPI00159F24DB|nr:hypothetical protein [Nostoc sp. KVJ20]